MAERFTGQVEVVDDTGNITVTLSGKGGDAFLGGRGQNGAIFLSNRGGNATIALSAATPNILLRTPDGKDTVIINGDGNLRLNDSTGRNKIIINGDGANITVGGNGSDGDVVMKNGDGKDTIRLDGGAGDILLLNGDCAEDFDVADSTDLEAGDVTVFSEAASLCKSQQPYDKRVAGVVAGARESRPGIVLGRDRSRHNRLPVALIGKVYCKVDAQFGSIAIGDLLTTSPTPGHAMKASDPLQAFGAVIGKALEPWRGGRGMIPILVALQ
jgi:hypothetical protein